MFKVIPLGAGRQQLIRFTVSRMQNAQAHVAATTTGHGHGHGQHHPEKFDLSKAYNRIGKREVVGFGPSGEPNYFDMNATPLPAIRWKEDTAEIAKLREKAKGDWGNLTIAEKKELYRADFRSTFAEFNAPTGEWKYTIGMILAILGGTIWVYFFVRKLIYSYPRPAGVSLENQERQLERMIAEGVGKVHGISSKWDYEKGDWKK